MPNTYFQMYVQTVFAVKYRKAQIRPDWNSQLFAVIGNLINEANCKTLIVNGVGDHVHCLFGFRPVNSISKVMQSVKAKSSKWINEQGFLETRFEWQDGYGSFTYSHGQINTVYRYIQNQVEHHQKETFIEEYKRMLKKYGVEFDEKYIFKQLI
jgi:REP element-mobilizing transposase RayT